MMFIVFSNRLLGTKAYLFSPRFLCRCSSVVIPPYNNSAALILQSNPQMSPIPPSAQWHGFSLLPTGHERWGIDLKTGLVCPSFCFSFLVLTASLSLFQPLIRFFPFLSSLPLAHEAVTSLVLRLLTARPGAEFISKPSPGRP